MARATSHEGLRAACANHCTQASGAGPAGQAFMSQAPQKRAGSACATARPRRAPSSWPTSTMLRRSSASTSSRSTCTCHAALCAFSFLGWSLRPKPGRSGTTTRWPAWSQPGSMGWNNWPHEGLPCRHSQVSGASHGPSSTMARRRPASAGRSLRHCGWAKPPKVESAWRSAVSLSGWGWAARCSARRVRKKSDIRAAHSPASTPRVTRVWWLICGSANTSSTDPAAPVRGSAAP